MDESRGDDDPFALKPVAEGEADQRPNRRRKRDDGRVAEAGRHGDPLLDEERGDPIREAVEADGLEDVEHAHQDHAAADGRDPEVDEAARRRRRAREVRAAARAAVFGGDLRLDRPEDAVGLGESALPGKPTRAFGQAEPQEIPGPARPARRTGRPSASPAIPSGAAGTSTKARNEMTGTQEKPMAWLTAKARPRSPLGASSLT